jgi:hypothetical protein
MVFLLTNLTLTNPGLSLPFPVLGKETVLSEIEPIQDSIVSNLPSLQLVDWRSVINPR